MFYKKQAYGAVVNNTSTIARKTKVFDSLFKAKDDVFIPPTVQSLNWVKWTCLIDKKTCLLCLANNGRIFSSDKQEQHHNCRCTKVPIQATLA